MARWEEIEQELQLWAVARKTAQFWWRDDDAVAVTPALEQLVGLQQKFDVPLVLAVIPANLESGLADRVNPIQKIGIVQHGYAHINHAQTGEKTSEFPDSRDFDKMMTQIDDGWNRMSEFRNLEKVFVPPWNRVSPNVTAELLAREYTAVSTFTPRTAQGMINAHADIIDWRRHRGFAGDEKALENILLHLRGKRLGEFDQDEPTGLLSHHLDHDDGCWTFIDTFLGWTQDQQAVEWVSGDQLFGR
jgi:hypothetical protein